MIFFKKTTHALFYDQESLVTSLIVLFCKKLYQKGIPVFLKCHFSI